MIVKISCFCVFAILICFIAIICFFIFKGHIVWISIHYRLQNFNVQHVRLIIRMDLIPREQFYKSFSSTYIFRISQRHPHWLAPSGKFRFLCPLKRWKIPFSEVKSNFQGTKFILKFQVFFILFTRTKNRSHRFVLMRTMSEWSDNSLEIVGPALWSIGVYYLNISLTIFVLLTKNV